MYIAVTSSSRKGTHSINKPYMSYVKKAGHEPLLVTSDNDPQLIATLCDGLVLSGGVDIDPIFYGENNIGSYATDLERDVFERALLRAFITMNKPIFGICRGLQLIVREYMRQHPAIEKLMQFWQNINEHSLAEARSVPRTQGTHFVEARMHPLYGGNISPNAKEDIFVNSMHHQGLIGKLTKDTFPKLAAFGFLPLAATSFGRPTNVKGSIIEAVEIPNWDGARVKAVQWHPEELCMTEERELALITTLFVEEETAIEDQHE